MFCGADSSPLDVSTAMERAFEEKSAGLAIVSPPIQKSGNGAGCEKTIFLTV
jgi:hypothetical protein